MDGYLDGWSVESIIADLTRNATISIEQQGAGLRMGEKPGWIVVVCPKSDCRPAQSVISVGLREALVHAHSWLKH